MLSAALLLAIALVALYVVRSIRTYYALKDFGGHWSVGWSRIWLLRTQSSGYMNKTFTAVNNKYGESMFRSLGVSHLSRNVRFAISVSLGINSYDMVVLALPNYRLRRNIASATLHLGKSIMHQLTTVYRVNGPYWAWYAHHF